MTTAEAATYIRRGRRWLRKQPGAAGGARDQVVIVRGETDDAADILFAISKDTAANLALVLWCRVGGDIGDFATVSRLGKARTD